MTPAQETLLELAEHCFDCPDCRTEWDGDTPVRRQCPVADGLSDELRQQQRHSRPPGLFCERCGRPIAADEQYVTHANPGASGAGGTVYLHLELCERDARAIRRH